MGIDLAVTIVSVDRVDDHEIIVEFSDWTCAVFTIEELIDLSAGRHVQGSVGLLGQG